MYLQNPSTQLPSSSSLVRRLIAAQFFPDLQDLDDLDICPSLKNFEFSGDKMLALPFLKPHSDALDDQDADDYLLADKTLPAPSYSPDLAADAFDGGFDGGFDDNDGGFGGDFHATTDGEFGKGGENWADGVSIMGDEGGEAAEGGGDWGGGGGV